MDIADKKRKIKRIALSINAVVFGSSIVAAWINGSFFHMVILALAVVLNLFLFFNIDKLRSSFSFIFAQFLNAIIAFLTAMDYVNNGSTALHYVWFLTAFVNLAVIPYYLLTTKFR